VLLNNDTVVPKGWLNQLVGLASVSATIGLVGPMSNYATPPQLVETVPYRVGPRKNPRGDVSGVLVDVDAVYRFADEFQEEGEHKGTPVERLGGFCLLVKRIVLKKIENTIALRDWTDLRLFDTDLLGIKARQVGFSLALCRDLFVHHFGTRTFAHGSTNRKSDA
jgi:GT2 family glycosyltransferase